MWLMDKRGAGQSERGAFAVTALLYGRQYEGHMKALIAVFKGD